MHVLIVTSGYPTTTDPVHGIFEREQAQALRQVGHKVGVIAPVVQSLREWPGKHHRGPGGLRIEDDAGIPAYRFNAWGWLPWIAYGSMLQWLRLGRRLFRQYILDRGHPDIIHAHSILYPGVLGVEFQQQYGIPLVVTEHSTGFARGLIRSWQVPLVRRVARNARACLAVSPALASLLNKKYSGNNTPWIYMPNMVDTDFFCPQAPPGSGTPTVGQPFIFFTLGLLTAKKGHRYLIEGFAQHFRGENVQLFIGGEGEERSRLESAVRNAGIQNQVAFLGAMNREQVLQAMLQCHAFVLPSLYETFGVVIIEALACGKPVVATHCGGPEVLVNARNGLLVPPGDAAALGRAMKHIVSYILEYEPEDIRAECVASFGRDAVVRRLNEIYCGLAASSDGNGVK